MANYNNNNNNRSKKSYFDQYVNFDQFLTQHNINNWSPLRGPQSGYGLTPQNQNSDPFNSSFQPSNGVHSFQSRSESNASDGFNTSSWVQNSTLTPTASEFIPQQTSSASNPSSSSLLASATEFVPRSQKGFAKPSKEYAKSDTKHTAESTCDKEKIDKIANKVTDENASKTDSVIEALCKTHISDGNNTDTKLLNSSGGAIKKVRSQDYRNDSRDRHSNGESKFIYKITQGKKIE